MRLKVLGLLVRCLFSRVRCVSWRVFGLTGFERVILLRNDISFDATYFKLSSLFLVFVCLAGIAAPSDQILIECG